MGAKGTRSKGASRARGLNIGVSEWARRCVFDGNVAGAVCITEGMKSATKFVSTPEVRVQYVEYGNPAGEPVVFLHGFPDAPVGFEAVIGQLDLKKLRVVAPYLRGFGESEATSLDLVGGQRAALGSDLLGFADALELGKFHLVAHDWGASAAYAGCVFAPERVKSLVALASPYVMYDGEDYPPAQVRAYWYQTFFQLQPAAKMLDEHAVEFCEELWRSWSPGWKYSSSEFREASKAWGKAQFTATVLHYYRMRWGGALSLRAYAALQARLDGKPKPKIATPSVFVHGAADACVLPAASDANRKYFSGAYERVTLKGVGHFPHREDAKSVAKIVARMVGKYS